MSSLVLWDYNGLSWACVEMVLAASTLCEDHVIQSMACQNAWCGFRSFGLALHKLWRIPSAGHLLKVFSSAMFRCIQLRMPVAWDVATGAVGLYRLILGMCWNGLCCIYFVGKDHMIQSMACQNAWCGFRSFGLALHKLWRIPSAGHLLKSSLQPCLDVSNWDASSMRCRHWCCGIITAYLGHVLNWSLLHLLCARTTWFRAWHARMHGVDSVRLGWLFTSSGEFLPQGIFWKSSLLPISNVLGTLVFKLRYHKHLEAFTDLWDLFRVMMGTSSNEAAQKRWFLFWP